MTRTVKAGAGNEGKIKGLKTTKGLRQKQKSGYIGVGFESGIGQDL